MTIMADCCQLTESQFDQLHGRQRRILWIVLLINLVMFVVEGVAGWLGNSSSLLADALDMLADTATYTVSLWVVGRELAWRAGAALVKGGLMGALGFAVLLQVIYRAFVPAEPLSAVMAVIGVLALIANLTCAALLWRHRGDDLNMRSTWLCSRNDVLANLGVLVAAAGVAWSGTRWPDLVVGAVIAVIVLRSAKTVVTAAMEQLGMRGAKAVHVSTSNISK